MRRRPAGCDAPGTTPRRAVSILLLGIPRPVGYWVADRFGDYFYRRNTNLRRNVAENMRHVMGAGATEIAVQGAVRRAFRMQARNGFDLLRVPRVSLKRLEQQVRLDGDWHTIDDALAAGRGVIICSAHYGAFDIMGQYIINRGYEAHLLVGRTTSHFVHDSVSYLRQSRGWRLEQVEDPGSVRRVMKALKAGKVAGMVVDRDWSGTGAPVTFFGAPTTLPTGHIRMALDHRCGDRHRAHAPRGGQPLRLRPPTCAAATHRQHGGRCRGEYAPHPRQHGDRHRSRSGPVGTLPPRLAAAVK